MTAIAKRSDRFSETEIDQEIVVMRLDNGEFYTLADTAATMWRLIDGTRDREALVASLVERYDCAGADVGADVDDFLAALQEMGLLAVD